MSKPYAYRTTFGILAGLSGGILMFPLFIQICTSVSDAFMMSMGMKPMMMEGPSPILVAMGMSVVSGGDMNAAANAAIALHFVTAIMIGLVFAVATAALYKPQGVRKFLAATNAASGLAVGITYGAIVWLTFFLPLIMFSFLPNLAELTAMDLHEPVAKVAMDMMKSVGGLAMGLTLASPLSYFLSVMGFCQLVHYTEHAIVDNVAIDSLTMKIDGTISMQRPRRFTEVTYEVQITSSESDERISKLAKAAAQDCYVTNTLKRSCKVTGFVQHNGNRIDTHID